MNIEYYLPNNYFKNNQSKMAFFKKVLSIIQEVDFFPAQQFLRYKGQPQYKTLTGGFCSLIVIVIFTIIFTSTGLQVMNKATVNFTQDIQYAIEPSLTTLKLGPSSNFMFAINVFGLGLRDSQYTYFDVSFVKLKGSQLGLVSTETQMPLEFCTPQHFNFNPQIQEQYYKYNGATWLCPPIQTEIVLNGHITSSMFQQIKLYIKKCDSTLHNNCAPDAVLQGFLQQGRYFTAVMAIMSASINPQFTQDYIGSFLDSRNQFPFTTDLGIRANGYIADFTITTDTSLLPFTVEAVQQGIYVPDVFQHYAVPVGNDVYATIIINKSEKSLQLGRSFQKIDQFFSYVGGFIGIIFSLIFFLNAYSQVSFTISLGDNIFKYSKFQQIDSKSFNIFTYIWLIFFRILNKFGCCAKFHKLKIYQECKQQVERQIDIAFLLKRISFLQKGIKILLQPHQYDALWFCEKSTLQQAKQLNDRFKVYPKYKIKQWTLKQAQQYQTKQFQQNMEKKAQFSSDSQESSMKSKEYYSLKGKLGALAQEGLKNNVNQRLLKFIRRDIIKSPKIRQSRFSWNQQDQLNEAIGKHYFKQLSNPHLRQDNGGVWGKLNKRNENDSL